MMRIKKCYCHTCEKYFHSLGIMRHRAMHRDKKQDCKITFGSGETYSYKYVVDPDDFELPKYNAIYGGKR